MKFLIDMPLSPALVSWLRAHNHDAVHAASIGLDRAPDRDIIALAKQQARTVVTADLDYPRLLALTGADAPSIILFRGGDWSDADTVRRMAEVLGAVSQVELAQSILVIERDRVRRRHLPIR